MQRALVAVAMDNQVITFDLMLGPETPKDVQQEGLQIVNTFAANKNGEAEVLQRSLQQLQQTYRKRYSPQAVPELKRPPGQVGMEAETGTAKVQDGGKGELEIAVNPDGKKIVIASNASLKFSSDGGKTFNSGSAPFNMNDPTMARGHSGDFYLGQIAFPNGTSAQKGVKCTDAVSRSTDGGTSFQLMGFSAVCGPGPVSWISGSFCFPDQPHIAADSFTPGSLDQVYAVWRHFNSINVFGLAGTTSCTQVNGGTTTPAISCSRDSGKTWKQSRKLRPRAPVQGRQAS